MKIFLGVLFGTIGIMVGLLSLAMALPNTIRGHADPWMLLPVASGLSILTSYYLLREEK